MTEKRQEKILKQYLNGPIDESILNLSVQEIIFLYEAVLGELKKDSSNEEMAAKKQEVFSYIIIRLMRSGTIYIAYHTLTGYPYIDVRGHAWLFSEKEFSDEARKHYMELGIPVRMKKLVRDDILREMYELERIGVETMIIDNGQKNVILYRQDITGVNENLASMNHIHPELMNTILNSAELAYASNGKHPSMPELDKKIQTLITESHLLVPVKLDRHLADGETLEVKTETSSQIALVKIMNSKNGYITAFTDWNEFTRAYSKDEWNAIVMDYPSLKDAASKADGFVINPSGIMFMVGNQAIEKSEIL